jgi:hypothetical protein
MSAGQKRPVKTIAFYFDINERLELVQSVPVRNKYHDQNQKEWAKNASKPRNIDKYRTPTDRR